MEDILNRGRQTFSIKGQITNILGCRGQMMSVATTQLCPYKALLMSAEIDILYNAHILFLTPHLAGHWPY